MCDDKAYWQPTTLQDLVARREAENWKRVERMSHMEDAASTALTEINLYLAGKGSESGLRHAAEVLHAQLHPGPPRKGDRIEQATGDTRN